MNNCARSKQFLANCSYLVLGYDLRRCLWRRDESSLQVFQMPQGTEGVRYGALELVVWEVPEHHILRSNQELVLQTIQSKSGRSWTLLKFHSRCGAISSLNRKTETHLHCLKAIQPTKSSWESSREIIVLQVSANSRTATNLDKRPRANCCKSSFPNGMQNKGVLKKRRYVWAYKGFTV